MSVVSWCSIICVVCPAASALSDLTFANHSHWILGGGLSTLNEKKLYLSFCLLQLQLCCHYYILWGVEAMECLLCSLDQSQMELSYPVGIPAAEMRGGLGLQTLSYCNSVGNKMRHSLLWGSPCSGMFTFLLKPLVTPSVLTRQH